MFEILKMMEDSLALQITSLFEDIDEKKIDDYERNILKKINDIRKRNDLESNLDKAAVDYIDYTENKYTYGYDDNNIALKANLEKLFLEFRDSIAVETRILRDQWKAETYGELNIKIERLKKILESCKTESKELKEKLRTKEKDEQKAIEQLRTMEIDNNELQKKVRLMECKNKDITLKCDTLKKDLEIERSRIQKTNDAENDYIKNLNKDLQEKVEKYEQYIVELESNLKDKEKDILKYKDDLSLRDKDIKKLKKDLSIQDKRIENLEINLNSKENEAQELKKDLASRIDNIKELKNNLTKKDIVIKNINNKKPLKEAAKDSINLLNEVRKIIIDIGKERKIICCINIRDFYNDNINNQRDKIKNCQNNGEILEALQEISEKLRYLNDLFIKENIDTQLQEIIEKMDKLQNEV